MDYNRCAAEIDSFAKEIGSQQQIHAFDNPRQASVARELGEDFRSRNGTARNARAARRDYCNAAFSS
jgi:hypothetical protein